MNEYHKIQTIFKRDPETNYKTLLMGDYSLPEFKYLKDNKWVFTEKVDGTNIRVMFDGKSILFGGKTDKAQLHADLVKRLQERFLPQIDLFIKKFDGPEVAVCFYGEGYGAGIQKGGKYREDKDFVLFDIKVGPWWLRRVDVEEIAEEFGLDVVPIIGYGSLDSAIELTREGFTSQWGDFTAEGIVARPEIELRCRNGSRMITKIKHKDFN